jgi:hypothetical protein
MLGRVSWTLKQARLYHRPGRREAAGRNLIAVFHLTQFCALISADFWAGCDGRFSNYLPSNREEVFGRHSEHSPLGD